MLNHIDTDISPLPFVFMLYKNSPLSGLLLCLQSVVIKTTTTTKPEKPNWRERERANERPSSEKIGFQGGE